MKQMRKGLLVAAVVAGLAFQWGIAAAQSNCEEVCVQTQKVCVRQETGCAQTGKQCAQEKLECAQKKNVCVQKNTRTGACTQYQEQCARYERRCAQYREVCLKQKSGCAQYQDQCVKKEKQCKPVATGGKTKVTQKVVGTRGARQTCQQCMAKLNACFARCDKLNDLIMQNRCVNDCNRSTCVKGADCD